MAGAEGDASTAQQTPLPETDRTVTESDFRSLLDSYQRQTETTTQLLQHMINNGSTSGT